MRKEKEAEPLAFCLFLFQNRVRQLFSNVWRYPGRRRLLSRTRCYLRLLWHWNWFFTLPWRRSAWPRIPAIYGRGYHDGRTTNDSPLIVLQTASIDVLQNIINV